MNNYDVIIVGGGTAGLLLAKELGKQKHKILLIDRKDNLLEFAFNTLASILDLDKFELSKNVVAQEIDTAIVYSKSFRQRIKFNSYTLDKRKVHEEILELIDTDFVDILLETNIVNIIKDKNGNYLSVVDKLKNEYNAKIFVDASGTNGIISKKIGLQNKKIELATGVEYNVKYIGNPNELHILIGKDYKGGYGWVFPLKNERAIIGFGTYNQDMIKGLKGRLNKILELPTIKKLVVKDNDKVEGGSIPLTPVLDKFVDNNLICVGDSVSQVNPVVGEGYKFIFESALMASKSIHESLKNNDFILLLDYENNWRKRFLSNYKRSKIAQQRIYRFSKSDFFIDVAMLLLRVRSNKKNIATITGEYK